MKKALVVVTGLMMAFALNACSAIPKDLNDSPKETVSEVSSETVSNLGNYDHGYGFCVLDGKCISGRAYFQLARSFQIWN